MSKADYMRERKLRVEFGLTLDDYDRMFTAQSGLCAICHLPETSKNNVGATRRLAVDHDHETKAVRALLCSRCNVALGMLDDDLDRITEAAEYLRAHKK